MQSSTPISNPIDIFPKNAEFQENLISIADETPSDDNGEQEEISRKRKGKSVGCKDSQATPDTQQSKQTEDEPYKKKPRKKNSACWEFLDIVVEGVNQWAVCKLCKTRMAKTPTTGTTTFNRHVDKCKIKHGLSKQTQLQFQGEKLSEVKLASFKYDHAEMRKAVSHYIMINELPFMHTESFMFNFIM
ncbi:hypothetical protein POM88_019533 [Heracleum sosnowskyi]|uniref:BED-type domain-containing protein n=1 Tax=Heracleum sosnowskyi TaxID=360622 RepID=A0AAD8MS03_9APIA|nr:hypothetical protein POM88_019533 [Heracleum sosnowskyi]